MKIFSNIRMLLLAVAVLSVTATGIFLVGYVKGRASVQNQELRNTVEKIQSRDVVELTIMRKPKNEVQKLLEQKWCRDCQ